jgi:Domain of unknown function (DUF5668)
MDTQEYNRRPYSRGSYEHARWIPALILIAIGAAFLLNNLQIVPFYELLRYWPVVLIAFGLFWLVDSSEANQRIIGGVLIVVGALLLAGTLGFFYLSWNTLWPLLLIAAGLLMLVQRLSFNFGHPFDTQSSDGPISDQWLHEFAIFSGGKRRVRGEFKGGKLDCVFGGFEINLRQATMSADSAVLEINAVLGGAEVKIPESWEVVMKGVGVFGGYGDETSHPNVSEYPNPKRLILKGAAVFGGVNVKN